MAKGFKTGGREVGTPNKVTNQIREAIVKALTFIDGDPVQFQQDIEALTPSERLKFYVALLEYVQPKLARVESQTENIEPVNRVFVTPATPEQMDLIKKLQERAVNGDAKN